MLKNYNNRVFSLIFEDMDHPKDCWAYHRHRIFALMAAILGTIRAFLKNIWINTLRFS